MQVAPTEDKRPMMAMAAVGAGQCLLALGERESAIKAFQTAVELNPALRSQLEGYTRGLSAAG